MWGWRQPLGEPWVPSPIPQAAHLAGKLGQNEGCAMYVGVVVFQLHLFHLLLHQLPHRLPEVGALGTGVWGGIRGVLSGPPAPSHLRTAPAHWVFAAQHEANLPAGIGGDGAVRVVHYGEERLAELPHLLNEVQVQPLALPCGQWAGSASGRQAAPWPGPSRLPCQGHSPWQQRMPSPLRAVFMSW